MHNFFKAIILPFLLLFSVSSYAKDYTLLSPDKKTKIEITVKDDIRWSVSKSGEVVLQPSPLAMSLTNGQTLGEKPYVRKALKGSANETITAIVPVRNRIIPNVYNELKLQFKGGYAVNFRAYNDGAAYRFETSLPDKEIEVQHETANFNLAGNYRVYWPLEEDPNFQSHYEATFKDTAVAAIGKGQYGYLPLLFTTEKGTKVLLTEADLHDYPNLFLFGTGGTTLTSAFPKVILESRTKKGSDRDLEITKKADYIAKTSGSRTFPWRVLIVTDDKGLLETDMVYKLSTPNVLQETAWIKPGKVAWDWWNANNIYDVDFKSGINTDTYKSYVDFASDYGLEYIILDEGWSASTTNLMAPNSDLDVEALIKYADSKNVGIILWALWNTLDEDIPGILDQFKKWGAKGVKVDFMARGDQYMVNFYERVAKETAKRNMLADFHGAYKPVGLNRKYPNVINYEGVKGLENDKWTDIITPEHDVTLPFTRMVARPMDYTPGAMINATKDKFRIVFEEPMSQGTRAHQAAMYVVYDAPLQMLSDNPTHFRREPEFTKFISRIPTVWDKTVALDAKAGDYVVVAKKNGNKWYIGAMTDWDGRTLEVPLTFLDGKKYKMEVLQDGINADRQGEDYKITEREVSSGDKISIKMSSGGGWVAVLTPVE